MPTRQWNFHTFLDHSAPQGHRIYQSLRNFGGKMGKGDNKMYNLATFGFQEQPINSDTLSRNNPESTDLLIWCVLVSENGHDFYTEEAETLPNEKCVINK